MKQSNYFFDKNVPADSDDVKAGVDGVCLIVYDKNTIYYGCKKQQRSGKGFYFTIRKKIFLYDGEWSGNLPTERDYFQLEANG